MAKPIAATPTLAGKDAERIRKELQLGSDVDPHVAALRADILRKAAKHFVPKARPTKGIMKKYKGW